MSDQPVADEPRPATATQVVHLGRPPRVPGGPVNPDVTLTSTYHQGGVPIYGRDDNPTWQALEAAVGGLEGGRATSFASGLAAVAAVVELLPVPGRVVVDGGAYNGTRQLLADVASRGRLRVVTVDTTDTAATLEACRALVEAPGRPSGSDGEFGAGGLLWLETPTNPLLGIADIAALVEGVHALGMHVAVDNTFATPLLQRPLEHGADVVVHSMTKFLAGHSDVLLGATVAATADLDAALRRRRTLHGAVPGPFEAWLVLRGIRTLAVRMERSCASAADLAQRLAAHPAVEVVRYPGLASHPGHRLAAAQMAGPGAVLSFDVAGGAEAAEAMVAACRLATPATSLGGVETLLERRGRYPSERRTPPGLVRLSVGIEDADDLWADLSGALSGV
ncbi:MAG TPA: PLP-dependent transferase [Acidimicrobiales bacterium]|nr:PLP-dependent transferase [Acidimicrobiales bacterium]